MKQAHVLLATIAIGMSSLSIFSMASLHGDVICHAHDLFELQDSGELGQDLIPGAMDQCETLYLTDHHVGDKGAEAVAHELTKNDHITVIYAHYANIGDDGATALANALKENQHVEIINFGHNHVSDIGAKAIADMIKVNTKLHTLTLDHNKIHIEGVEALVEAVKENKVITSINVHGNSFNHQDPPHARALEQKLVDELHANEERMRPEGYNPESEYPVHDPTHAARYPAQSDEL